MKLVGWSPDGKAARLSRDWKSGEVGKWEEEHKHFRTTGERVRHDIYLVDHASDEATPVEEEKSALIDLIGEAANQPKLKWPTWMFRRHGYVYLLPSRGIS